MMAPTFSEVTLSGFWEMRSHSSCQSCNDESEFGGGEKPKFGVNAEICIFNAEIHEITFLSFSYKGCSS